MKYKYGDFYTESTLYMYSIRRVIMYNCHLAWWSGAIQRCYSVTSTERSFNRRSKKRLETSKHPLNGDRDILMFESIEGWSKKTRQDLETNIRSSNKSVYDQSSSIYKYTTRRAWRHTFAKSDWRLKDLSRLLTSADRKKKPRPRPFGHYAPKL